MVRTNRGPRCYCLHVIHVMTEPTSTVTLPRHPALFCDQNGRWGSVSLPKGGLDAMSVAALHIQPTERHDDHSQQGTLTRFWPILTHTSSRRMVDPTRKLEGKHGDRNDGDGMRQLRNMDILCSSRGAYARPDIFLAMSRIRSRRELSHHSAWSTDRSGLQRRRGGFRACCGASKRGRLVSGMRGTTLPREVTTDVGRSLVRHGRILMANVQQLYRLSAF